MNESNYYLGALFTLIIYIAVLKLGMRRRLFMYNSVLYSTIIIVAILILIKVDYDVYSLSVKPISSMLSPLVVLIAIPLYGYKDQLKHHFRSILLGICISGITSASSVVLLGKAFNLDQTLMLTLIPKSITTPMAISMSSMLGGVVAITVIAVIITGIIGASVMHYIIDIFNLKSPVAIGVALGSTSHGIGTSKAIELGPDTGAISGLAMGLTGVIFILTTSFVMLFI